MSGNTRSYFNSYDRYDAPAPTTCRTCLDLRADYLGRRYRHDGFWENPKSSDQDDFKPDPRYHRSLDASEIQQSAQEANCHGCGLLWEALKKIEQRYSFPFTQVNLAYREVGDPYSETRKMGLEGLEIQFERTYSSLQDGPLNHGWGISEKANGVELSLKKGDSLWAADAVIGMKTPEFEIFWPGTMGTLEERNLPWSAILTKPLRSDNTGSREAIQWASTQLAKCRMQHYSGCCPWTKTAVPLPTRVLDLGDPAMRTAEPVIKLYISKGAKSDYLCLSHCWGASTDRIKRPLETTKYNIASFQKGVAWSLLPKTFQDAVIFTRGLGFRYLWIDSLCIIQGSEEDWSKEAGRMAAVFANAVLVLSAASSANSQEGLFRKSNTTLETLPIEQRRYLKPPHVMMRKLLYPIRAMEYMDPDDFAAVPLLQRAWAFQERLVARRTLFFTPFELVWECWSTSISESGHRGIDRQVKEHMPLPHADAATSYEWQNIVNSYTNLKLSYRSDTLPALAGLAKVFARFLRCDYLAGLWRDTLVSDLKWERLHYGYEQDLSPLKEIPTWSWACLGGQMVHYSTTKSRSPVVRQHCDVVAASCTSSLGDNFVQVNGGRVVISGYLMETVFQDPRGQDDHGTLVGKGSNPMRTDFDAIRPDYRWLTPPSGRPRITQGAKIYLMPLESDVSTNESCFSRSNLRMEALVLYPTQSAEELVQGEDFVRIGIARLGAGIICSYPHILEGDSPLISVLKLHLARARASSDDDDNDGSEISGDDMESANGLEYYGSADDDYGPWMDTQAQDLLEPVGIACTFEEREGRWGREKVLRYNAQHIAELKRQLETERARVKEWRERNERGEPQVHKRVLINIL